MALKIIGSGFGRTGTMSTKMALEELGFGPCHHMLEVMLDETQLPYWTALADHRPVDWAEVFARFTAQVDWPGARVWSETARVFPEAKVIHTYRPAEDWWASFEHTIGKFFLHAPSMPLPPYIQAVFATMDRVIMQQTFGGKLDRDTCIAAYEANDRKVRAEIPADRLLVFTPADGWAPLCAFLGVPVPDTPFPRSNARDEFWAHFGGEPAKG